MTNEDILPGFDEESSSYLKLRLKKVEGEKKSLILELAGSVDTYNANYLRRSAMKAIDAGFVRLIFLLRDVEYVSSAGVGIFISLLHTVTEKGGDLAMVSLQPKVMTVFKLMCLDTYFRCTDSVDEAFAHSSAALAGPVFPKRFKCPICDKGVVAAKPGRYRCPACKSVLAVDEAGGARLA